MMPDNNIDFINEINYWKLSIFDQLKEVRRFKMENDRIGSFYYCILLSPELCKFAYDNNLNVLRPSKIKKYDGLAKLDPKRRIKKFLRQIEKV